MENAPLKSSKEIALKRAEEMSEKKEIKQTSETDNNGLVAQEEELKNRTIESEKDTVERMKQLAKESGLDILESIREKEEKISSMEGKIKKDPKVPETGESNLVEEIMGKTQKRTWDDITNEINQPVEKTKGEWQGERSPERPSDRMDRVLNKGEVDNHEPIIKKDIPFDIEDVLKNNKAEKDDGPGEKTDVISEAVKDFRSGLRRVEKSSEAGNIDRIMERREKEISDPLIREAREKRTQILEDRGLLQMSREDFKKYFVAGKFDIINKLRQTNVGDCYAVAAIHAMSESPHFELICRSSMKKLPDGSWEVKIPLLSDEGEVIKITPEELKPQRNKKFLKGPLETGGIIPDFRFRLKPLSGKEGLKVLEAAFIKQKFGSVDRLASEGGWGDDVLFTLGGDNFRKFGIDCFSKFNVEKQKWDSAALSSLPKEKMDQLEHYLNNFNPETDIATANTKNMNPGTISGIIASGTQFFKGEKTTKLFVPGHAYSVTNVDSARRMITLSNPWNTMNSIKLNFEQFKEIFDSVRSVRIDSAKILKNMKKISEKKAA